jgi:hypothetical protein
MGKRGGKGGGSTGNGGGERGVKRSGWSLEKGRGWRIGET